MNIDDYPIRTLLLAIDAVETASLAIATGYDGRIPSRAVSAMRETVAVAKVRAEDLAIEAGVDLAEARKPDAPAEPEIDADWPFHEIGLGDKTVMLKATVETVRKIVDAIENGEDGERREDLQDRLTRAKLALVEAQLADRKPIYLDGPTGAKGPGPGPIGVKGDVAT